MFGQQKDYFSKQYRRRALCSIVLYYVTFLSAFRDDSETNLFPGQQLPTLSGYRPFAPHAQVISQNEIQIKWLPTSLNRMEFRAYYELYTDDDIEYVGQDLTHVAKRLHYGKEYMFKLRVCSSLVPGDCSQFSMPRFQKLTDSAMETSYQTFLQTQMRVFPMIALLSFFLTISLLGLLLLSYLSNSLDEIPFDINGTDKARKSAADPSQFSCYILPVKQKKDNQDGASQEEPQESCVNSQAIETVGNKTIGTNTEAYEFGKYIDSSTSDGCWQTLPPKKTQRKRYKSLSNSSKEHNEVTEDWYLDYPDSNELFIHRNKTVEESIVVVVDNSNIFIGARETVCQTHTQIKPKHVKLRLQQLLNVVENNRKVSRGFTAGSSPPTSEHVWDIYRRHGYIVDLEERRGKDEQRVDESLHLSIYKALVELPAQTLILVTGDGNKGKSRGDTSFIGCAIKAIQLGWKVEIFSWKHSLSSEWCKLGTRFMDRIKIIHLDKYLNILTQIERRNSRKKIEARMN